MIFFFNKQTFSEVQSSMGSSLCLFPPMNGLHFRQQFVHIGWSPQFSGSGETLLFFIKKAGRKETSAFLVVHLLTRCPVKPDLLEPPQTLQWCVPVWTVRFMLLSYISMAFWSGVRIFWPGCYLPQLTNKTNSICFLSKWFPSEKRRRVTGVCWLAGARGPREQLPSLCPHDLWTERSSQPIFQP